MDTQANEASKQVTAEGGATQVETGAVGANEAQQTPALQQAEAVAGTSSTPPPQTTATFGADLWHAGMTTPKSRELS